MKAFAITEAASNALSSLSARQGITITLRPRDRCDDGSRAEVKINEDGATVKIEWYASAVMSPRVGKARSTRREHMPECSFWGRSSSIRSSVIGILDELIKQADAYAAAKRSEAKRLRKPGWKADANESAKAVEDAAHDVRGVRSEIDALWPEEASPTSRPSEVIS